MDVNIESLKDLFEQEKLKFDEIQNQTQNEFDLANELAKLEKERIKAEREQIEEMQRL